MKYFWICSLLILMIESCTIQKRQHLPGYYIHFHHKYRVDNQVLDVKKVRLDDTNSYVFQSDTVNPTQDIKEKQLIVDQTTADKLESTFIINQATSKSVSITSRQIKLDEIDDNLDEKEKKKIKQNYNLLKTFTIVISILFSIIYIFSTQLNPIILPIFAVIFIILIFLLMSYNKKYGKYLIKNNLDNSSSRILKEKPKIQKYVDKKKTLPYFFTFLSLILSIFFSLNTFSEYFLFNIYIILPLIIPILVALLVLLNPNIKFVNNFNPKIITAYRLLYISIIFNALIYIFFIVSIENTSYPFFPWVVVLYLGISFALTIISLIMMKKHGEIKRQIYFYILLSILLCFYIFLTFAIISFLY